MSERSVAPPADTPAPESIGRAAGRGLRWSLAGTVASKLGSFAMGLALARLLAPEDFGMYAIALAALAFVIHINDVGLIAATVQWRGRLEDMAPTASALALLFSVITYAIFFVGAQPFATLAGSPHAAPIVQLLTTVILIDGVIAVRVGALQRTFQHDKIVIANVAGLGVNASVAISLAVLGAGPYSFVVGHVASSAVAGAIMFIAAKVPVKIGFDRAVAARLMRFGIPLAISLGVEAILLNTDYVIVGRIAGATALGFYLLAYNVSSWVPAAIGTAIRYVSVPSFSRLSEDEGSLAPGVQRAVTLLATAVLPVAVLIGVLGQPLVVFLYGERWAPSGPVLQILAILGLIRMLVALVTEALMGAGYTKTTLWLNLGWAVPLVPALIIGTHLAGTQGTAVAHAVVAIVVAIPLGILALRKLAVPLRPLGRSLRRPLLATACSAGICALVSHPFSDLPFVQLCAAGMAGVLSYVMIVVPVDQLKRWGRQTQALVAARAR